MQKLVLLVVALVSMAWLSAQENSPYLKKQFVSGTDTLNYRILYPEKYDPSKKYPLILFLHGAGERGKNNEAQLKHGGAYFTQKVNRKKFPAIVVIPQCPFTDFWARITLNFKEEDSLGRLVFPGNVPIGKTLGSVSRLMDSLAETNSVNKSKIYIGGLSMGGMATFEMLWRKPKFFAAAFAICGGGNAEKVSEYGPGFPIWVFHGDQDPTVKVSNSRLMVNALRKAGAKVRYTEYPGVLHNSWLNAFAEKGLMPWLMSN
ncbi:MAG: phospholipase [Chitinophagaceae bacterium]|nr:MAG: phospholipase [Chitinophagaceae bacterium]